MVCLWEMEVNRFLFSLSDPSRICVFDFGTLHILILLWNLIETSQGYQYKQNAQEIFENFFGTNNPFAAFGFESMPFASRLNKPGPAKAKPVMMDLECTLKGKQRLLGRFQVDI